MYSKLLKKLAYYRLKRIIKGYASMGMTMISTRHIGMANIEHFKDELLSDGFSLGYANDNLELIVWS